MIGYTKYKGHKIVSEPEEADIIIVNTCSFIAESRKESIENILYLSETKKDSGILMVTGCLSESNPHDIEEFLPEVDVHCSCGNFIETFDKIDTETSTPVSKFPKSIRQQISYPGSSYVKISEGCNRKCTFCTIPLFKGKLRSRSADDIIEEVKWLSNNKGTKEIVLVAQDLTSYGVDRGTAELPSLLRMLTNIRNIEWIRLLYLYPDLVSDELIEVVASEDKICNYFDIPFQHFDEKILRRMGRNILFSEIVELIELIRSKFDEVSLRTTIMVGFPGEGEEEFETLINAIGKLKFNNLGVFSYSKEENTPSAKLDQHVDHEIKLKRYKHIMELQKKVSGELLDKRKGKSYQVLIEENFRKSDYAIGRSQFEAPEIDGSIVVISKNKLNPGQMYGVKVTDTREYDLVGEVNE